MTTLVGLFTLGRDAELRHTANQEQVASLALAYNYGRKDPATGKTPSQWVEAALWGERAGKLAEYLTKGSQFYMQLDDLHVETFTKRDTTQGVKLVGRVGQIEFTRGQRTAAPSPAPASRPASRAPAPASKPSSGFDDMDDDIPF